MKRLTLLAALLLPVLQAGAQHATIMAEELVYELSSPTNGQYSVHRKVLVHNEKGLPTAAFWEFTDAFHSVASFSGTITYQGKSRKIKKDDLINHSLTDGLADDAAICLYQPSSPYPFTVEYDYTVSCKKGIASFPTFMPLDRENVSLVGSSYTLIVPSGFAIQYFASEEPTVEKGKQDRYQWKFAMPDGFREEHLMPSILTIVPYVFSSPVDFSYGGTTGSQRTWKDIGLWLYGLQDGAQDLPDDAAAKFREMTKDCKTTEEKVAVLYRYLRDYTRYVSIQLGIGGLKPFPASTVYKSGFGDCKALSNFMKAALAAVGVESDYFAVSTSHATLFPGYVSIGQMDHVMLAVPLKEHRDTLWVECTNPVIPLGYRHDDVAGHEVLLVKQDGGERVRVPSYPDSLRCSSVRAEITVRADGTASLKAVKSLKLDRTEAYLEFSSEKPEDQARILTGGWNLHAENLRVQSIKDNLDQNAYRGRDFCPQIDITFTADVFNFAKVNGNRIFIPANPVAKSLNVQRQERVNDIRVGRSSTITDTVVFRLPEGYRIESLPKDMEEACDWDTFTSRVRVEEDGTVVLVQTFAIHKGAFPKERYESYRAFAKVVNRSYGSSIVLVKD